MSGGLSHDGRRSPLHQYKQAVIIMTVTPLVIHTAPDSDLGALIKNAADSEQPLTIDTGEAVYVVEPRVVHRQSNDERDVSTRLTEEEIASSQDGIRRSAGSWRDIDVDKFKSYIAERRRSSNRPPVQW